MNRFLQTIELLEFAREWIEHNDTLALAALRRREQLDAVLREYQSQRRWLVQYTERVRGEAGLTSSAGTEERFLQNVFDGLLADALDSPLSPALSPSAHPEPAKGGG